LTVSLNLTSGNQRNGQLLPSTGLVLEELAMAVSSQNHFNEFISLVFAAANSFGFEGWILHGFQYKSIFINLHETVGTQST